MSLRNFQSQFIQSIYGDSENFVSEVAPGKNLAAKECVGIYQTSVNSNLIQVLSDIYPVIKKLLGEPFFNAMAKRYIAENPSRSEQLDDYGEFFPSFVSEFQPLHDYPYMADVAQLEWVWHQLFHAADEVCADFTKLSSLSPEQQNSVVFQHPKAFLILCSKYPVDAIWWANQENAETEQVSLDEGNYLIAVYREGLAVKVARLSDSEHRFLLATQAKLSLAEIAETWSDDNRYDEILVGLIQKKLLTDYYCKE